MPKKPATVAEYINAAPREERAKLRELRAILKKSRRKPKRSSSGEHRCLKKNGFFLLIPPLRPISISCPLARPWSRSKRNWQSTPLAKTPFNSRTINRFPKRSFRKLLPCAPRKCGKKMPGGCSQFHSIFLRWIRELSC